MTDREFPSLYAQTGDIKDINKVIVPRLVLRELLKESHERQIGRRDPQGREGSSPAR